MLLAIAVLAPVQAASVNVSQNVVLNTKYGKLTVANNQQYDMFALYANGTMFFNYTGFEDHIGHFTFTVQSYGNGSLVLRFKGAIPTVITQTSATTVFANGYEQITYTTSQTSALDIQFFTNPRFSLTNGALAGTTILVFIVVARMAYVVSAKDPDERLKRVKENQKMFLILALMFVALMIGASLFP